MITVTLQIGNSDNKLTQHRWMVFCNAVHSAILFWDGTIHFSAPSVGWADWQNAAWVFLIEEEKAEKLRKAIKEIRETYEQESAAWTVGETLFI